MPNRVVTAVLQLIRVMQATRGVDIVYHRLVNGVDTTLTLVGKAWTGQQRFRVVEGNVSRVYYSDRDYFLPVSELDFGDGVVEPQRGDWIEEILPDPRGTQKFELAAPFDEPVFRLSDPQGYIYRMHTKRMNG